MVEDLEMLEGCFGFAPDAPDPSLWIQHQDLESRLTCGPHGAP